MENQISLDEIISLTSGKTWKLIYANSYVNSPGFRAGIYELSTRVETKTGYLDVRVYNRGTHVCSFDKDGLNYDIMITGESAIDYYDLLCRYVEFDEKCDKERKLKQEEEHKIRIDKGNPVGG